MRIEGGGWPCLGAIKVKMTYFGSMRILTIRKARPLKRSRAGLTLQWGAVLTLLLFSAVAVGEEAYGARAPLEIEALSFYDWEVAASSKTEAKKSCHIQFQGVSRQRVRLTMRLSMLKEHPSASNVNAITILKISADQINKTDRSDIVAVPISNAWIETATVTTLGELERIGGASELSFLAASKGAGLFFQILRGVRKDGLVIGYRSKTDRLPKIFQAPPPPTEVFEQLRNCLAQNAALF